MLQQFSYVFLISDEILISLLQLLFTEKDAAIEDVEEERPIGEDNRSCID